jgi:N-acetylneuraminic acid mutarotase
MLGRDVDANPTQYRTWVVDNEPDFTGASYTGLKSGDRPFADIVAYYLDGYAIVDFNFPMVAMPRVTNWDTTRKVLPESIYDGQLAIIDGYTDGYTDGYDGYDGYNTGYVYIFGGKQSAKIWRAPLNNPTNWEDTQAFIPDYLSSSQIAIIGDKIYLFGGESEIISDKMYSASIYSPLEWVDHGPILPVPLKKSQLSIIDGYVYLFGGYSTTGATNSIFRAPINNLFFWEDTGKTLPIPIYSSHLGIINDRVYLFGGQSSSGTPVTTIMTAPIDNPTEWQKLNNLPNAVSNGHFFTIGDKGYLISAGAPTSSVFQTKIFKCDLASPTQWVETKKYIPGNVTESHLAVIYDRIFLFGGNGISVIFASNYLLKYNISDPTIVKYGDVTRTQYNASNKLDLFKVIGFQPWRTDYGS